MFFEKEPLVRARHIEEAADRFIIGARLQSLRQHQHVDIEYADPIQ